MKFDLKMHPEKCEVTLKDNYIVPCPFYNDYCLGCSEFGESDDSLDNEVGFRLPECIAEEQKQKESEGKS